MKNSTLKLWGIILALFAVTMYYSVNSAGAVQNFAPTEDAWTVTGNPGLGAATNNILVSRAGSQPDNSCTVQGASYLKFVLSASPSPTPVTLTDVTLTLDTDPSFITGVQVMEVWGSNDDSWGEAAGGNPAVGQLDFATRPTADVNLGTTSATVADPGTVTFATSAAIVAFIQAEWNGDGVATLIVQPRVGNPGDCVAPATAMQTMDSKDQAAGTPANLQINGTDATAVSLLSSGANNGSNLAVWIGLLLVLALALTGFAMYRKQQNVA